MRRLLFLATVLSLGAATFSTCWADPCGMVPPVLVDANETDSAIKRVGAQMTYLFYSNGVATMVLRPGFEGKVDEFGMLIPFPTPPELRKVSDDIFSHLAAAADPPEVTVDITPIRRGFGFGGLGGGGFGGGGGVGGGGGGGLGFQLKEDEVRVVREEAVGSYEVAVLEAGSAKALETWMADHSYKYPQGMDEPVNDYVADRWCFVAMKARVAQADSSNPQPGQREISNELPDDSTFDGHVQAMEFRFRTKTLVVPMRLSAFNPGETRNVVYVLTNAAAKIRQIPEEYVVRQISGRDLHSNLTSLLPIRLIGGSVSRLRRLPFSRRVDIADKRKPGPVNGLAAELIAADISVAESGDLLSHHELKNKAFDEINRQLGMKGSEADELVGQVAADNIAREVEVHLKKLRSYTLTIVDGEFPRDVIAKKNLTFQRYAMAKNRNNSKSYDPKKLGPAESKPGLRVVGQIDWSEKFDDETLIAQNRPTWPKFAWLVFAAIVIGVVWLRTSRR